MYFWNANEEVEWYRQGGRLYLRVIHRNHPHNGMMPHAHILDLTALSVGEAEVERDMNRYCGMAEESGHVEPY